MSAASSDGKSSAANARVSAKSIWKRDLLPKRRPSGPYIQCCGGANQPVTNIPLPFFLSPARTNDGEQAFLEPMGQKFRFGFLVGGTYLAVFSTSACLAAWAGAWWIVLAQSLGILISVLVLYSVAMARSTARRLVFSSRDLTVSIQVVRANGLIVSESRKPAADCKLSVHPVCLKHQRLPDYSGWLARVVVHDLCFTLACSKEHQEVLEYVQRLPAWLVAISATDGEPLIGTLSDKWLGEPPPQYRKWW